MHEHLHSERLLSRIACLEDELEALKEKHCMLSREYDALSAFAVSSPHIHYSTTLSAEYPRLTVTPNVQAILGHTPQSIHADPQFWTDHVHPDDAEKVQIHATRQTPGSHSRTYRFRHADGSWVWLRDEMLVTRLTDGETLISGIITQLPHCPDSVESSRRKSVKAHPSLDSLAPLSRSLSNLDTLLADAHFIFFAADLSPEFHCTYVSPNITAILGYTQEETLGDPLFWNKRIYPGDTNTADIEDILFTLGHHNLEYRFKHADGSWRWIREALQLFHDEDGAPRVVGLWTDITSERQAGSRAKRQESFFKAIFETSPSAILIAGGDTRLIDCNAKACELFGYPEDKFIGMPPDELTHPDDFLVTNAIISALAEGQKSSQVVKRYLRSDGSSFWADARISAIFDNTGKQEFTVITINDITSRIEYEQALKDSESEKLTILSTLNELVARQDRNHRILWANAAAANSIGSTPEALVGKHCYSLWQEDNTPCPDCPVEKAFQSGNVESSRMTTPDGRIWHVEGHPLRDDDGIITGAIEVTRDITKQVESERTLRESEKEKNTILSTISELVARQDTEHRILWTNAAAAKSISKQPEELKGKYCYDLWQDGTVCPDCPVERALQSGKAESNRMVTPDGRTWSIVGYPLRDSNGEIDGAIEVTREITEQAEAERALIRAEAEKKLILSTITETVVHQTPDHRIIWANAAAAAAAGLSREEMTGQLCHKVFMNCDSQCSDCLLPRTLQTGSRARNEVTHADGTIWEVQSYPIRNDDGEISSIIKVSREITESKRIEQDLRRARDLAENADKMKTEFLANMSHELRSPLNGVLGMLDVLMDTELDADQQDCVETALQAGEGLLTIINDILDFSKLQADMITLSHDEFNLRRTIRMVFNTFQQQSKRKDLTLSYSVADDIPRLLVGDEGRVRQILFNLIGNAVKFTPTGSVRLGVDILRKPSGAARLLFTITDTGIGIPEDEIESIFDPFIQLNWGKSRKYEGTGLGLGIVKRLVSRMGGIITVESVVEQGTTVEFWINVGLTPDDA